MVTAIRYRWRYYNEARRRYCISTFHCTWEHIWKEHPEATPVEGTRQELELLADWRQNSTAKFGQAPTLNDNDDMCGRYVLHSVSRYHEYFDAKLLEPFADRYNIAPSSVVPVIRQAPDGQRRMDLLRWGLIPNWAKDESIGAKLNNARGESVAEKPSFRTAYRKRRCIVPASGFYEWQPVPGQKWKQPYYITRTDGHPMAMGGLWESWMNPNGEMIRTFCIITTAANETMAPIHDRMPVILPRETWKDWLDPTADMAMVVPMVAPTAPDVIETMRVSRMVSNAREDGPELIEPIA